MSFNCKLLEPFFIGSLLFNKNIRFDIGYPKYQVIYGAIIIGVINELHRELVNEISNGIKIQYETI